MPSPADNVILTFPPRTVSQEEQMLLAEWFAATQRADLDVERAYISERRGDDPKIVGRIVVVLRSSKHPAFLVFAPTKSLFWVVTAAPAWDKVPSLPHTARSAELDPARTGRAGRHANFRALRQSRLIAASFSRSCRLSRCRSSPPG